MSARHGLSIRLSCRHDENVGVLLTLTTTTPPARELGLLLRKHPDRVQTFELSFGTVAVVYPEATDECCTAALVVEVDPVSLIRGRETAAESGGLFEAYINDRPYTASSFLSVAIARVLGSALGGKPAEGVDVTQVRALQAVVEPIRFEERELAARLFEPLGYRVEMTPSAAEHTHYARLTLAAQTTLQALLTHLYVLVPVLDNQKHYWVSEDELDKLFRFGAQWLAAHPERDLITRRYLRRAPALARAAVAKLAALDDAPIRPDSENDRGAEDVIERPLRLQERRIAAVVERLRRGESRSIVDVGCGEGDLLAALVREGQFERIGGTDVSSRELERAKLRLDGMPMALSRREQITLFASSLVYADKRLRDYDAAALLEVIEHIDPHRLATLERTVFAFARPRTIVITTPNRDYNVLFTTLANGAFRHPDHRFEWSRSEFEAWSMGVAQRHGYRVEFDAIGDAHAELGAPTQMAVFECN